MANDDDFRAQIVKTLAFEGGYANNPDDPGGETNFGISKRSYPDINIATLTETQAIEIYHRDYWLPLKPDRFSPLVASKLFDLAVNMGQHRAVTLLQRAINHAAARNELKIDGTIGPRTIYEANRLNDGVLMRAFRVEAMNYYTELVARNPDLQEFIRGWTRRAMA